MKWLELNYEKWKFIHMRNLIKYIILFLLFPIICSAETIYSPITHVKVYEYVGNITKDTVFKSSDFKCPENDISYADCHSLNLYHPVDYANGLPLDGFDFWAWEKGRSFPAKVYPIYTFLVKRKGNFVWEPYSKDEISNLMGE